MSDNVTPIRDAKGRFPKGVSGNPHGVSAKHRAIKQMQRTNEELLTTMMRGLVPDALKLHKALLKNGIEMSIKEMIQLITLTYEYGIGKPRQAEPAKAEETEEFDLASMPQDKREAIIAMLNKTADDASKT